MTKYERATVVNTLNVLNMILNEKQIEGITEVVYTVIDDGKAVKWSIPRYETEGKCSDITLAFDLDIYTKKLIQYEANKYANRGE